MILAYDIPDDGKRCKIADVPGYGLIGFSIGVCPAAAASPGSSAQD
jgi:hypothetical protein